MTPRPPRAIRAARGAAAAAIAVFAATVTHATAQGAAPSVWLVVLALALATPVSVLLAGRRMSVARLAVAVAVSQVGFHALLRIDVAAGPVATGHAHGALVAAVTASPVMHDLDPSMWAGHAVAAALTLCVLACGEQAVVALVALARRPFRALAGVVAPGASIVRRAHAVGGIRPLRRAFAGPHRRGPPVLV